MEPARKSLFASLVLLVIAGPLAFAQTATTVSQGSAPQAAEKPASSFEVASVRLSPPNAGYIVIHNSGSPLFTARNATLRLLIGLAFAADNITGGPKWIDSQGYDVSAKAPGEAPLTPKQFQPLLQQLLKDRFHLATHRETVYRSGYALVVAKNGPHLQPGKAPSHTGYIYRDGLMFEDASMQTLASALTSIVGRPVADKTGIHGEFNINLKFAPFNVADSAATDSSLPFLFTALEKELGMKLVPDKKVPVEILVIDHVDRIPTEN